MNLASCLPFICSSGKKETAQHPRRESTSPRPTPLTREERELRYALNHPDSSLPEAPRRTFASKQELYEYEARTKAQLDILNLNHKVWNQHFKA